jgi:hypothetical protein
MVGFVQQKDGHHAVFKKPRIPIDDSIMEAETTNALNRLVLAR